MPKVALTQDVFPNKPVHWMDGVGPVILAGNYAFCCEYEADKECLDVSVMIYEKPEAVPKDPAEMIQQTKAIGTRNFDEEDNPVLHIRNFIMKFIKDEDYRKDFMI